MFAETNKLFLQSVAHLATVPSLTGYHVPNGPTRPKRSKIMTQKGQFTRQVLSLSLTLTPGVVNGPIAPRCLSPEWATLFSSPVHPQFIYMQDRCGEYTAVVLV